MWLRSSTFNFIKEMLEYKNYYCITFLSFVWTRKNQAWKSLTVNTLSTQCFTVFVLYFFTLRISSLVRKIFFFVISKEKDTLTWHPQLAEARGHIGIKRLAVITWENLSLHYNHCFLKPSSLREHSNCVWYIKKRYTFGRWQEFCCYQIKWNFPHTTLQNSRAERLKTVTHFKTIKLVLSFRFFRFMLPRSAILFIFFKRICTQNNSPLRKWSMFDTQV